MFAQPVSTVMAHRFPAAGRAAFDTSATVMDAFPRHIQMLAMAVQAVRCTGAPAWYHLCRAGAAPGGIPWPPAERCHGRLAPRAPPARHPCGGGSTWQGPHKPMPAVQAARKLRCAAAVQRNSAYGRAVRCHVRWTSVLNLYRRGMARLQLICCVANAHLPYTTLGLTEQLSGQWLANKVTSLGALRSRCQ